MITVPHVALPAMGAFRSKYPQKGTAMWQLIIEALVKVGLPIGAAIGVVYSCRRFNFPRSFEGKSGDVEGIYVTVLATIYAVVLAFMVFVVWTRYDSADSNVDAEATVVTDISRLARALPEPSSSHLRDDCRDYVTSVVTIEWPAMAQRKGDRRMRAAINTLWEDVFALQKVGGVDSVVRDHLYERMLRLNDLRRARQLASRTTLPSLLWALLYFGGLLVVFFASIFTVEQLGHHLLKAVALTALISLTLFVVSTLDHPFQGYFGISPSAFRMHAPSQEAMMHRQ